MSRKVLNITKATQQEKYQAISDAGFRVENMGKYLVLIDKNAPPPQKHETTKLERCMNTIYTRVNDILEALVDQITDAEYIVIGVQR